MRFAFVGVLSTVIACVCASGCASEEKKHPQENNTRAHLSPRAKKSLSAKDVDEIAELIGRSSDKLIMAISAAPKKLYPNAWDVTIGYSQGSLPDHFGICIVTKEGGTWKAIAWANSLGADMVGASFRDAPD